MIHYDDFTQIYLPCPMALGLFSKKAVTIVIFHKKNDQMYSKKYDGIY